MAWMRVCVCGSLFGFTRKKNENRTNRKLKRNKLHLDQNNGLFEPIICAPKRTTPPKLKRHSSQAAGFHRNCIMQMTFTVNIRHEQRKSRDMGWWQICRGNGYFHYYGDEWIWRARRKIAKMERGKGCVKMNEAAPETLQRNMQMRIN